MYLYLRRASRIQPAFHFIQLLFRVGVSLRGFGMTAVKRTISSRSNWLIFLLKKFWAAAWTPKMPGPNSMTFRYRSNIRFLLNRVSSLLVIKYSFEPSRRWFGDYSLLNRPHPAGLNKSAARPQPIRQVYRWRSTTGFFLLAAPCRLIYPNWIHKKSFIGLWEWGIFQIRGGGSRIGGRCLKTQ